MTRGIVVRRAADDDAATVTSILAAAFEPLRHRYTPAAFAATVVDPDTVRFLHAARRLYTRAGFRDEEPGGDPPHLHGTPLIAMVRSLPSRQG